MGVQCGGDSRADARLVNTRTPPANSIVMYSKLITSAATIILLLCLVETGSGIQCHICNSYDHYHCGDPFYYPDNPGVPKTNQFLQDCPHDEEYNTEVCSCEVDGCTSASMYQLSAAVVSAVCL